MTYSYTQISQYLSCPRRYRHRYLDGWQEKDTRAAMLFGRAFEQAVAALFRREDPAAALCEQWSPCKDMDLTYSGNDTWDRMLQQGVQLLERFAQDGRVRIRRPRSSQQIQFNRMLGSGNNFVSYVDAIGELDGTPCVLEWKTSSARYPEEPAGISALDPQLVCYSWMTGIDEVARIPPEYHHEYKSLFKSRLVGVLNGRRKIWPGFPVEGVLCATSFQPIAESCHGLISADLSITDDLGNTVRLCIALVLYRLCKSSANRFPVGAAGQRVCRDFVDSGRRSRLAPQIETLIAGEQAQSQMQSGLDAL